MQIDKETLNKWSASYRNWNYHPDFVVSASLEKGLNFTMVDEPGVFRYNDKWHMFYFGYDKKVYQSCLATSRDLIHWQRYEGNPVIKNNTDGYDVVLAANPEIYWDKDRWAMFYFSTSRNNPDKKVHVHSMMAFSLDLIHWTVHPEPILIAGDHHAGLDETHEHNISLVYNEENDTHYMFYCVVGKKGRGIGLLTNKSLVE